MVSHRPKYQIHVLSQGLKMITNEIPHLQGYLIYNLIKNEIVN